jgi:hypothetical protein
MGPSPSGGGSGGADNSGQAQTIGSAAGLPSGGGTGGQGGSFGSQGGGWTGDNGGAQNARDSAAKAAGDDLGDGGDAGPRRSGGGGGDQHSADYTNQINALGQAQAMDNASASPSAQPSAQPSNWTNLPDASPSPQDSPSAEANGDGQGGPPAPPKPSCADLEQQVQSAQRALTDLQQQFETVSAVLDSNRQALLRIKLNSEPQLSQADIDDRLVGWTGALTDPDPAQRRKAKAMVTWLGQLKLTGSSDPTPVINYYQQAITAGLAQVAALGPQEQAAYQTLQDLQAKLQACQAQSQSK